MNNEKGKTSAQHLQDNRFPNSRIKQLGYQSFWIQWRRQIMNFWKSSI